MGLVLENSVYYYYCVDDIKLLNWDILNSKPNKDKY